MELSIEKEKRDAAAFLAEQVILSEFDIGVVDQNGLPLDSEQRQPEADIDDGYADTQECHANPFEMIRKYFYHLWSIAQEQEQCI